jgi:hypothetical protein
MTTPLANLREALANYDNAKSVMAKHLWSEQAGADCDESADLLAEAARAVLRDTEDSGAYPVTP